MARGASVPPTLVVGMHRSGTTMITGMLGRLGFFTGWWHENQLRNHLYEASFFLDLNRRILRAAGGSWQNPEGIEESLRVPRTRARLVGEIRARLAGLPAAGYLGPLGFVRYGTPAALDRPWGWKDPRSTLTLPLWLEIFPEGRALHVLRHGVDVAGSLVARDRAILDGQASRLGRLKSRVLPWRARDELMMPPDLLLRPDRSAALDRGVEIWGAYTAAARRHAGELGARGLEIRYEEFLREPRSILRRIAAFCGLDPEDPRIETVASEVRADRAYAFRRDPELAACAERTASTLARFGY